MRPNNSALFYLWGLFWLLMVAVALQDERDSHDVLWWEPLLWEGSSCLVATVWLLLQRRVASRWEQYSRRAAALVRPASRVAAADRGHLHRLRVRHPPRRLCAGRPRSTSTIPGRSSCSSTRASSCCCSPSLWLCIIFGLDELRALAAGARTAARAAEAPGRIAARAAQGAAAAALPVQRAQHHLLAHAGRRGARRPAADAARRPAALEPAGGRAADDFAARGAGSCWSCTRRSCRSASRAA